MEDNHSNSSDDLFLKYQKLATEYSKMRAKITVLKKAVTDEQAKNQELKDGVKGKDQGIRKMELEIESLKFRNDQLAKRVGILQDELSLYCQSNNKPQIGSSSSSSKKSTNKHSTHSNHSVNHSVDSIDSGIYDVINNELKNKIEENEKLHLKIHAIEQEYQMKIQQIQKELESVKTENQSKQVPVNESKKLVNLEQELEKWKLESQILQVKYEREQKKVQELEAKVQGSIYSKQNSVQSMTSLTPSFSQRSIDMNCAEFASASLAQSPSQSDDKISIGSNQPAEDDLPQVTSYLKNRIAQLIDNLHLADSKSISLHSECVCLQQRLVIAERERKSFQHELSIAKQTIQELSDELKTRVMNYEEQLSTITEHLANMNDKMSNQKDEIDALRHNNSIKIVNSRKSRNK